VTGKGKEGREESEERLGKPGRRAGRGTKREGRGISPPRSFLKVDVYVPWTPLGVPLPDARLGSRSARLPWFPFGKSWIRRCAPDPGFIIPLEIVEL